MNDWQMDSSQGYSSLLDGPGQMGALRLETVLIGQVVDGVGLAIVADIGVGAAHHQGLVVSAHVLQLALLLVRLAVARLHAAGEEEKRKS